MQIRIPRLPKASEVPAASVPDPSEFYTTVEVPVRTLADVFGALEPQPAPSSAAPPILSVPIIVAPVRPVTAAGAIGTSAGNPAQGVAIDVVAVGVRTPQLTGSLPQTVQTAPAGSLAPTSGRATRLGDPRLLRNPTAAERFLR